MKNEDKFCDFLEDLLRESEEKDEQLTLATYDMMLIAIRNMNQEIADNFQEADKEKDLIDRWVLNKNSKLQNKIEWLEKKLEAFIKDKGQKTIDLANGKLKFYFKPDKIEISDLELFMKNAKDELLSITKQIKPDLNKIKNYLKNHSSPPDGVTIIKGQQEFTYKIKEYEDGKKEVRTSFESGDEFRTAI